jgi:hypothetical protein
MHDDVPVSARELKKRRPGHGRGRINTGNVEQSQET